MLLLLAVAAIVTGAVVTSPATASSGTLMITVDTTLSEDHQGSIVIGSDNVTLDCAGHTVSGPGTDGLVSGIVAAGRTGVTIKNCHVTGFVHGIRLFGAVNAQVRSNIVTEQTTNGIFSTDGGVNNSFRSNDVAGNGAHGIILGESVGGELLANTCADNGRGGITLIAASGTTIASNAAHGNGWSGILLIGSSSNALKDNKTDDNVQSGISLNGTVGGIDSNDNTLTGNTATGNQWFGIDLAYFSAVLSEDPSSAAFSNTLKGNTASRNAMSGFGVFGESSFNVIQDNRARNNVEFDGLDDSSGAGNTWTNNGFGTTSGL